MDRIGAIVSMGGTLSISDCRICFIKVKSNIAINLTHPLAKSIDFRTIGLVILTFRAL